MSNLPSIFKTLVCILCINFYCKWTEQFCLLHQSSYLRVIFFEKCSLNLVILNCFWIKWRVILSSNKRLIEENKQPTENRIFMVKNRPTFCQLNWKMMSYSQYSFSYCVSQVSLKQSEGLNKKSFMWGELPFLRTSLALSAWSCAGKSFTLWKFWTKTAKGALSCWFIVPLGLCALSLKL